MPTLAAERTHIERERYTFVLPEEIEAAFVRTRGKRRKCSREDFAAGYLAALEEGAGGLLAAHAQSLRRQTDRLNHK